MDINQIQALQYDHVRRPSLKDSIKYGVKSTVSAQRSATKDVFVTAAGIGASVGAAAAVKNSATAQKYIKRGVDWVAGTGVGKTVINKAQPILKRAVTWVKQLPGPAKLVLGAGLALTTLLHAHNRTQTYYNQGKLDQ